MTFQKLEKLLKKYNISNDVHLMSDSGWECSETDMDGVFYNKKENLIIFTQDPEVCTKEYRDNKDFILLL